MKREFIVTPLSIEANALVESPTPAIIVWLILQALAIALAAFRIPLWIHAPEATEFLAPTFLFAVQILAAAMLSPRLCRHPATAVIAVATAWPFIVAANFLAAAPVAPVFWAGAYVTAWVGALTLLQSSLNSSGQIMAAGWLGAWSASGPILLIFMGNEQIDGSLPVLSHAMRAVLGPLISGMSMIDPGAHHSIWQWAPIAGVAVVGGGMKWAKKP